MFIFVEIKYLQASVCLCNGDGCNGKGLSAYYLETKEWNL